MLLTGEKQSTRIKNGASAALYTTNPILIGVGLKAGLLGGAGETEGVYYYIILYRIVSYRIIKYTILTTDKHPCTRWDSIPQSEQASGRRPTP